MLAEGRWGERKVKKGRRGERGGRKGRRGGRVNLAKCFTIRLLKLDKQSNQNISWYMVV